jgi:hypothetical protein
VIAYIPPLLALLLFLCPIISTLRPDKGPRLQTRPPRISPLPSPLQPDARPVSSPASTSVAPARVRTPVLH